MYNEIDLDKIDLNSEAPTEEPARQTVLLYCKMSEMDS